MWIILPLLLLLIIVCILLFAPFYLEVNSVAGLLGIRFWILASARLVVVNDTLICMLYIVGWHKEIDLLVNREPKKIKEPGKPQNKKSSTPALNKIFAVIKTFKVNKCDITIDTGDMTTNALLHPVFYWVGKYTGRHISINFTDENKVILEIENNFARMMWAYVRQ
jgi:hypothetical protein